MADFAILGTNLSLEFVDLINFSDVFFVFLLIETFELDLELFGEIPLLFLKQSNGGFIVFGAVIAVQFEVGL